MNVTIRTWQPGANPHFDVEDNSDPAVVAEALSDQSGLAWVDVLDPTDESFAPFAEALNLDPLAVEDALTVHERPKSLRYDNSLFVTAYTVTGDGAASRISLFLFKCGLLTVRLGSGFDVVAAAHTIAENEVLLKYGPYALELFLLDAIVDGYTARAAAIDEQVDDLESALFDDGHGGDEVAQETFTLHKEVGQLRRIVSPMREVSSALLRRVSVDPEKRELLPYAEDVHDHTMRAADWAETLRDNVESVRSTNLALVDNQLNTVMKKLTSWAAIIAVPTAVTGYFGQNVPYPGSEQEWGWIVSTLTMVALAGGLYWMFKRRGWL
ncbi:Mg2 transporter protein CorA family protein OS=Tsukamurella paurometabola (strain ATCC 8368 / DSM / CCUG 35730 / CIP 100753 / JCM 10117 / KCTC 9821 / NBRC 16120 / NCIMB 702349 / NCTC 13040) OX=521096 GN=Tpau_1754 PE=3 SV=1 [Tsukamurella paurometabola]|uniref:Mg2 transporter protein CorA family protein n=1 Tax=Tsukamurella paurometabola (strain ATCC 8368 / DSM 20162 / CCUG 35730 / CIP 100753 / JCM 10117 / KCTC 9821 / NBRC 16120 / NCIMB 702349 / NCTC 13040) TaxID=521096 RepID=D5UM92_TSUPD|nr:magnesium transporter CorA family protein [Tsukamurella paurometabola]ADG78372.1 Mg2 transporter protein CorA family protein [Tsukamurella paurometabola DSM 20162]SUP31390.1 Magnesium transport protein CorA [Tsukamurella paurometabola]